MQRKATKTTRGANADEKKYQAWCKERPCANCGHPPLSIGHHCEGSTFKHNKVLIGHWFFIPLCQTCDDIITLGSRRAFREKFGPQSELWDGCRMEYGEQTGNWPPQDVYESIMDWGR